MSLEQQIAAVHRNAFGRLVATLARMTRDLALAEDSVQEAFARAVVRWPEHMPEEPVAWLARTARNAAIDRIRQDRRHGERVKELERMTPFETAPPRGDEGYEATDLHPVLRDDLMRLVFTCCHPALSIEARVGLCLRTVCGLETREIARALIVPEPTLAQRLVRAKAKIKKAGIGYQVPEAEDLPPRLASVLSVVYLVFNEGYLSASSERPMRLELAEQAIRLGRILHAGLPEQSEVASLLALMLLHHSRRRARFRDDGSLVLLADQDRSLWDADEIDEGRALVHRVFDLGQGVSGYALQAAIAAVHAEARSADDTDWGEICLLYEVLCRIDPSPVVALNHAVAVAERDGPAAGLERIDGLRESATLARYHLYHAARGELLRRCDRHAEAKEAFREALLLSPSAAERQLLEERLAAAEASQPPT